MFEPVRLAPDIAQASRRPTPAAILSVALLLEHLELDDAARAVEAAVVADLAGAAAATRRTSEVGDAIAARVAELTRVGPTVREPVTG